MHKPHIPYITLCYFAQLIYKVRNGLCSAGEGMQFLHLVGAQWEMVHTKETTSLRQRPGTLLL